MTVKQAIGLLGNYEAFSIAARPDVIKKFKAPVFVALGSPQASNV
jgi:hypothetical protein